MMAFASAASEVLSFWLGGDTQALYKTKWFASNAAQLAVDNDIEERFGCLFDDAVSAAPALSPAFERWCCGKGGDTRTHLALVIVLDQFSRHIYRRRGLPSDAPERAAADALALRIAELLVDGGISGSISTEWKAGLSTSEAIFALMPFRHSNDISHYERLSHFIAHMERDMQQQQSLLQKFKKQTARRLDHLQDLARAEASDDLLEFHEFPLPDLSAALGNKLVAATEAFLARHGGGHGSIAISLSGGVDSMVIAKILCLLRDREQQQQSRLVDHVIAVHIDYANRAESAAEASFVEDWCARHDIVFHKRVVAEVTRGVTDRSEYERVSREIRYGFYKDVLSLRGARAVIFGHHLGDVQENVISNVMHGISPLHLSGMSAAGITNGVQVWRPLLPYPKDDIYSFAHSHGVPYFKDTTPSWSTRGKLRNKLVPLLIDMYGEGCLRNLSTLSANSDDSRDLVYRNVYSPFLESVSRRSCGLAVSALPFKSQPIMFWREMLKELVHSMGMSMVREKSAANFMERLQRFRHPVDGVGDAGFNAGLAGWLEMRKNFNCYLDSSGNLIIFHEYVFASSHGSRTETAINGSSWSRGIKFSAGCSDGVIVVADIGCWTVTVVRSSNLSTCQDDGPVGEDLSVLSFLDGAFSYCIPVHRDWRVSELAVFADCKEQGSCEGQPATSAVFRRIDSRLRMGIPLLVPVAASDSYSEKDCREGSAGMAARFTFSYKYNGQK